MRHLIFVFALFFTGCASMPGMPGYTSKIESKFDNAVEYHMIPAWVPDSSGMKMGLFWSSRMPKDTYEIQAWVTPISIFSGGACLQFKADGRMIALSPYDSTESTFFQEGSYANGLTIPSSTWSFRKFQITSTDLKTIINARETLVRLALQNGRYLEGELSKDVPGSVVSPFKDFVAKIEADQK